MGAVVIGWRKEAGDMPLDVVIIGQLQWNLCRSVGAVADGGGLWRVMVVLMFM